MSNDLIGGFTKFVPMDFVPRVGEVFIPGQLGPHISAQPVVAVVEHAPFPADSAEPTAWIVINESAIGDDDELANMRREWFTANGWHYAPGARRQRNPSPTDRNIGNAIRARWNTVTQNSSPETDSPH